MCPPDSVVDILRLDPVAAPQPLYPLEWSSLISLPFSDATVGSVGSLFGLKPYSSISLRRCSSWTFFCLRFLKNQIPAITRSATTTTGTTTATAVTPAVERPPPLLDPLFCAPPVFKAGLPDDVDLPVAEELASFVSATVVPARVAVTTTVVACAEVWPGSAEAVMTEVRI